MDEDDVAIALTKAMLLVAEGLALIALSNIAASSSSHAFGKDGMTVWASGVELIDRAKSAAKEVK